MPGAIASVSDSLRIFIASLDEDAFRLRPDTVARTEPGAISAGKLVFEDDFYGEGSADTLGRSVLIDPEMHPTSYRESKTGAGAAVNAGGQDDVVRVFSDPKTFAIVDDYFAGTLPSAGVSHAAAEKASSKE